MTARVLERRATYEDLLAFPEHLVAELVDSKIYTSPRPRLRHARAAGRLCSRLERAFDSGEDGPGGWVIVFEPELRVLEDAVLPNLAGWRHERAPIDLDAARIDIAPDWICEVLSPSTRNFDRVKKMAIYARHEVEYAWLMDPLDRTLEVKQLQSGHWTDIAVFSDGLIRAQPFDAIEIDLEKIWGIRTVLGAVVCRLFPACVPISSARLYDSAMSDFTVDVEREDDGRWIGEVSELPGVMVYGQTRDEAVAKAKVLAFRVLADRLEHGEEIPEIHGVFAVHG